MFMNEFLGRNPKEDISKMIVEKNEIKKVKNITKYLIKLNMLYHYTK